MRQSRRGMHRAGFSLIEVLIAIAIVAAIGGLVAVNLMGAREDSKVNMARIELDSMRQALDQFNLVFDRYPTEDEGIEVLWVNESLDVEDEALSARWRKFLNSPSLEDPWGNEWGYRGEPEYGEYYDLWSNGPDGEEGTADDIKSWDESEEDGSLGTGSGGAGSIP